MRLCLSILCLLALAHAKTSAKKTVAIQKAEIGVVDSDQTTGPKMKPVNHPDKLATDLQADHHHKIVFKFGLQAGGKNIQAHQAFVRLSNSKTGSEIIFVAEPDSASGEYTFDLDVNEKSKEFGSKSGLYQVHLIVGDFDIQNPIFWHVADINIKFQSEEPTSSDPTWSSLVMNPLPEIRHLFREPETRPPAFISNLFTILCLVPILIMFMAWLKIGFNISGFTFSLGTIGFHLGLSAIFVLYCCFWLQLNMFSTVKYLLMVGVVTFLCGNSMLVRIAQKRKQ